MNRIAGMALAVGLLLAVVPAEAATVDVALVLAVDVSLSVTAEEYQLQREGIARAFESPALVSAVTGGTHHAIDVTVLEWSDRDRQTVTVGWTRITDAASARAFAERVRATQRSSEGLTALGDAMLAAGAAFELLTDQAMRRVIDVSGDGMANIGPPPADARDALTAKGITINGLVILNEEPWVDGYYNENVVGGPGAFLMQVEDYRSFAGAIQQKLLSELVALPRPLSPRI
jgi:hypothetical protein